MRRTAGPRRPGLDDDTILLRYGALLWSAYVAFATDPSYFSDMAETANMVEHKQRIFARRSAVT